MTLPLESVSSASPPAEFSTIESSFVKRSFPLLPTTVALYSDPSNESKYGALSWLPKGQPR